MLDSGIGARCGNWFRTSYVKSACNTHQQAYRTAASPSLTGWFVCTISSASIHFSKEIDSMCLSVSLCMELITRPSLTSRYWISPFANPTARTLPSGRHDMPLDETWELFPTHGCTDQTRCPDKRLRVISSESEINAIKSMVGHQTRWSLLIGTALIFSANVAKLSDTILSSQWKRLSGTIDPSFQQLCQSDYMHEIYEFFVDDETVMLSEKNKARYLNWCYCIQC